MTVASYRRKTTGLGAVSTMAVSRRPGYAFCGVVVGEALVTAGPEGQKAAAGRRPRAVSADHRAAMRVAALATVVHMRRSRRFYQRVITVAIALGALKPIGQKNQASTMARLAAWDKRLVQRLERKAKRHVIKDARQMMRSRAEAPGCEGRGWTMMGVPAAHDTRDICALRVMGS
jgi:hypothetical protein